MQKESIAVIGGGMTGIAAALELAKSGNFDVTLFEKADHLGGLSDYYTWNDITWDRFYHVILSTDTVMLDFIKELGLEDQLFWRETKSGFFGDGRLASMSTTMDFIRFPFLSLWQKLRLGLGIMYSARIKDPTKLDRIYVRQWLTKVFGRRVYESIWDPLLRSKLGTARERTSAAFIWATITRLYGARSAENKQEKMGHVHGGYKTILAAAEKKLKELGVKILLNSPVTKIETMSFPQTSNLKPQSRLSLQPQSAKLISTNKTNSTNQTNGTNQPNKTNQSYLPQTSNLEPQTPEGPSSNPEPPSERSVLPPTSNLQPQTPEGSPSNLQPQTPNGLSSNLDPHLASHPQLTTNNQHIRVHANDQELLFNKALLTVSCPAIMGMVPSQSNDDYWTQLKKVEYLGVICVLLILSRKLSSYYVINLLDKELPFTGIIEATNIVSPDELDGNHLVYLPKYLPADDRLNSMTDAEITKQFVQGLKKVYPDLNDDEVLHSAIFREKFVQPLQEINYLDRAAGIQTPESNLFAVNTSMIYNSTLNNNAAITLGRDAVDTILNSL